MDATRRSSWGKLGVSQLGYPLLVFDNVSLPLFYYSFEFVYFVVQRFYLVLCPSRWSGFVRDRDRRSRVQRLCDVDYWLRLGPWNNWPWSRSLCPQVVDFFRQPVDLVLVLLNYRLLSLLQLLVLSREERILPLQISNNLILPFGVSGDIRFGWRGIVTVLLVLVFEALIILLQPCVLLLGLSDLLIPHLHQTI